MIADSPQLTRSDIASGLQTVGVEAGMNVVVHSSLSAFGRVDGGSDTIIDALEEVIGPEGTIVMPTFTSRTSYFLEALALKRGINGDGPGSGVAFDGSLQELYDTLFPLAEAAEAGWQFPWPTPEALAVHLPGEELGKDCWRSERDGDHVRLIREGLPRPAETCLPWHMPVWTGIIPATFSQRPEARRSHQYSGSFTACGPRTADFIGDHDNRPNQALRSHPLHRVKEADGRILLLGVTHKSNSTIHVAQQVVLDERNLALVQGGTEYVGPFQNVDEPLNACGGQKMGTIGEATIRLADTAKLYEVCADLLDVRIKEGLEVKPRS